GDNQDCCRGTQYFFDLTAKSALAKTVAKHGEQQEYPGGVSEQFQQVAGEEPGRSPEALGNQNGGPQGGHGGSKEQSTINVAPKITGSHKNGQNREDSGRRTVTDHAEIPEH